MHPAFGGFYQNAYVTTDLDQALKVFREVYGVPEFLVMPTDMPIGYRGGPGRLHLRLALANLNGVQIEVIQGLEGCVDLYREGLPAEGFGLIHHHVAMRVTGPREAWDRWAAETAASDRGFVLQGDMGDVAQFAYVDDKRRLGHYTEYFWSADGGAGLDAVIPRFVTGP
jgi:hypothetical protein